MWFYIAHVFSPLLVVQVDEIKAKDRTIFALEKELETAAGFVQKLQLQKDALDEQLFLVKEAECNLGSPKREIPGRAGDGAEYCGSPVSPYAYSSQTSPLEKLSLHSICQLFLCRVRTQSHKIAECNGL